MKVNPGNSSYSLKSQKLTMRISARGIKKKSANTAVNGVACHQAAMLRPGAGVGDGKEAVGVLMGYQAATNSFHF